MARLGDLAARGACAGGLVLVIWLDYTRWFGCETCLRRGSRLSDIG